MQLPPNLQVRRQPPLHKPTLPGGPPLDKTAEKWHLKAEKYETIQIRSGCAFAPVPVRRQSRDGRFSLLSFCFRLTEGLPPVRRQIKNNRLLVACTAPGGVFYRFHPKWGSKVS